MYGEWDGQRKRVTSHCSCTPLHMRRLHTARKKESENERTKEGTTCEFLLGNGKEKEKSSGSNCCVVEARMHRLHALNLEGKRAEEEHTHIHIQEIFFLHACSKLRREESGGRTHTHTHQRNNFFTRG